ncbi:MAG TPA: hypothetical protein VMH27_19230 [Puia sp.]|nr:hypothetical protein [Puia sp.]
MEIKTVRDKNFQSALFLQVDAGEASAIALAAENQPSLLIIDDLKGRRLPQIKPLFERIQATNFRIAPSLLKSILEQAGE